MPLSINDLGKYAARTIMCAFAAIGLTLLAWFILYFAVAFTIGNTLVFFRAATQEQLFPIIGKAAFAAAFVIGTIGGLRLTFLRHPPQPLIERFEKGLEIGSEWLLRTAFYYLAFTLFLPLLFVHGVYDGSAPDAVRETMFEEVMFRSRYALLVSLFLSGLIAAHKVMKGRKARMAGPQPPPAA